MSKAPKKPGTASTTAKSGAKASKGPGAKAAAAAASKSAAGAKGSKSFPCEQCTKVFNAAWKLKRHMRVHTGEKPFACDVPGCNKRYSEKGALVVHKKTKHVSLKPYLCPKPGCNRRFKIKRDVNNHLQNFHTLQKVEKREARLFERLKLLEDEYNLLQVYAHNLENLVNENGLQESLPSLMQTAEQKVLMAAEAAGKPIANDDDDDDDEDD